MLEDKRDLFCERQFATGSAVWRLASKIIFKVGQVGGSLVEVSFIVGLGHALKRKLFMILLKKKVFQHFLAF